MKSPPTTNSGCHRGKVPGCQKLGLPPEFLADLWTLKKKSPHAAAYTIFISSLSFFPSLSFFLSSFPPFLLSFPPFLLIFSSLSSLLFITFLSYFSFLFQSPIRALTRSESIELTTTTGLLTQYLLCLLSLVRLGGYIANLSDFYSSSSTGSSGN